MTLDGQNVEMAEIYDQTWMEASFSEDDGADELAMVIYEDFMELISETNGCSWNAECCEKEWIGTTSRWIGATQLGMWNPAAVDWSLTRHELSGFSARVSVELYALSASMCSDFYLDSHVSVYVMAL